MLGAQIDDDTVIASVRTRPTQTDPAQDRLGLQRIPRAYVDGEAHPSRWTSPVGTCATIQQSGRRLVLGGRLRCCRPAVRCRQDDGRCGGDGEAGATTLILVTNTVAGRQWKRTHGAYVTHRGRDRRIFGRAQGDPARHHRHLSGDDLKIEGRVQESRPVRLRDWGLIIYDEVHLLPAPVFRMTADLQSRQRLGLTATLVREDGRGEAMCSASSAQTLTPVEGHQAQAGSRRLRRGARHPHRRGTPAVRGRRERRQVQALLHRPPR